MAAEQELKAEFEKMYKIWNEHTDIVKNIESKLEGCHKRERILRKALEKISKYFVSTKGGEFGSFIGAGAVNEAINALQEADAVK